MAQPKNITFISDPLQGRQKPVATVSDQFLVQVLVQRQAAEWTVLTGAGVSTDSGIPDYRGPHSPKRTPMTFQTFLSHPSWRSRYWARSFLGWERMNTAYPNAGHLSLARLNPHGLITQNVDGLHELAQKQLAESGETDPVVQGQSGSSGTSYAASPGQVTPIVDLHGRLNRVMCLTCWRLFDRAWVQTQLHALNPDFMTRLGVCAAEVENAPDGDAVVENTDSFTVLDCPVCGGILKPDVVFFGESVPRDRAEAARKLVADAHGLVVLGSSLAVMSGLRLVKQALNAEKPVVVVTDGPSRADDLGVYRSVSRVSDFLRSWETALLS